MSRIAYPFLTLDADAIELSQWSRTEPDGTLEPLGHYLEDWDYQQTLNLIRKISINREISAMHLGTDVDKLNLTLFVRFGTGQGSMPRVWIKSRSIPLPDDKPVDISESIEGFTLSNRLRLDTSILYTSPEKPSNPLTPHLPSAIVWNDSTDVMLEGTEPRFPMESIRFSQFFAGRSLAGALWYLQWSPGSIHRDFGGSVRLFLNADRKDFINSVHTGDPVVMQQIMAGVMDQVITRVLSEEDNFEEIKQAEDGTIGGFTKNWLEIAFPGDTLNSIHQKMEHHPSEYHACIQAAAEMGDFLE